MLVLQETMDQILIQMITKSTSRHQIMTIKTRRLLKAKLDFLHANMTLKKAIRQKTVEMNPKAICLILGKIPLQIVSREHLTECEMEMDRAYRQIT